MKKYMPLLEALRQGIVKSEQYIYYIPDEGSMQAPGVYPFTQQILKTEFELSWHAVIYKDMSVFLVPENATKTELRLGYNTRVSERLFGILERYSRLYNNAELEGMGRAFTSEIYSALPEFLKETESWVYDKGTVNVAINIRDSVYNTRRGVRNVVMSNVTKFMRPIVFLPADIMVEINNNEYDGSSSEKALRLLPKSSVNAENIIETVQELTEERKVIPLFEAVRMGIINSKHFIDYTPDVSSVTFTEAETGFAQETAETELNLGGWHPFIQVKNDVYRGHLIAESTTDFCLRISNPFDIGIELLQRYVKLYDNTALGAVGVSLTKETFANLHKSLRCASHGNYWLAERYEGEEIIGWLLFYPVKGLYSVQNGYIEGKNYYSCNIRPVISLPQDIMVEIGNPEYDGSSPEKAFKLFKKEKITNS